MDGWISDLSIDSCMTIDWSVTFVVVVMVVLLGCYGVDMSIRMIRLTRHSTSKHKTGERMEVCKQHDGMHQFWHRPVILAVVTALHQPLQQASYKNTTCNKASYMITTNTDT